MSAFNNATLMITGGTGSFGSTVLKHFLDSDLKEIIKISEKIPLKKETPEQSMQ